MLDSHRIADACQHIGDGVSHHMRVRSLLPTRLFQPGDHALVRQIASRPASAGSQSCTVLVISELRVHGPSHWLIGFARHAAAAIESTHPNASNYFLAVDITPVAAPHFLQ